MRRIKRGPSLSDIATRVGASTGTVSRALRGLPGVGTLLAAQISAVAQEVGYVHRKTLLTPATNDHKNVLVLSQVANASLDADYLFGLSAASVGINVTVLLHRYPADRCGDVLRSKTQPVMLKAGNVQGIVLLNQWPDEVVQGLSYLAPITSVIHSYPDVDSVAIDESMGMQSIVQHLVASGTKRIGFFGACHELSWASSRYGAFLAAMAHAGAAVFFEDVVRIPLGCANSEGAFEDLGAAEDVLKGIKRGVDAWVCPSDMIAWSLYQHLARAGIPVPEKVSITGFYPQSRSFKYRGTVMTSTRVPKNQVGATALRHLLLRMQNTTDIPRKILLPCYLSKGNTTP